MKDPNNSPIIGIEYQHIDGKWRPHAVTSEDSTWDFDYCKRDDTVYYHDSGSGGDHHYGKYVGAPKECARLWLAKREPNETPEYFKEIGITILDKKPRINPFAEASECQGHMTSCKICHDTFPDNELCRHLKYTTNGPLGCGSCENDNLADIRHSLFALFDIMPPEFRSIIAKEPEKSTGFDEELDCSRFQFGDYPYLNLDSAALLREPKAAQLYTDGLAWLCSLGESTVQQNELTRAWIYEWEQTSFWNCNHDPKVAQPVVLHVHPSAEEFAALSSIEPNDVESLAATPFILKPAHYATKKHRTCNSYQFAKCPERLDRIIVWHPTTREHSVYRVGTIQKKGRDYHLQILRCLSHKGIAPHSLETFEEIDQHEIQTARNYKPKTKN